MFAIPSFAGALQIALSGVLAAVCLLILAGVVVFILVAIWVYRDAESRGMDGTLWLVLLIIASLFTFIGGLIVLIVYLILRSEHPVMYAGGPAAYPPGYPPPPAYAPPYAPPAYAPTPPKAPPPSTPPMSRAAPPTPAAAATCRSCGAPLHPGAAYCGRCGARV